MDIELFMQDEHKHRGMSTDTGVASWCAILFSQLRALRGAGPQRMKSRHGLVWTRVLMVGCALVRKTTGNRKHFIPIIDM